MASMIPPTNKLISGKIKETAWPLQSENQLQKKNSITCCDSKTLVYKYSVNLATS